MSGYVFHGKTTRILTTAMILAAFLVPLTAVPANALPAGWFNLRGTTRDRVSSLRSMDVQWPPDERITGFVRLRATGYPRDGQRWKVRFPKAGRIGEVRLQNKLTGQCVAGQEERTPDGGYAVILLPCTSEDTLWNSIPMGRNKAVFSFGSGRYQACLRKTIEGDLNFLRLGICEYNRFTPEMVWEAYQGG